MNTDDDIIQRLQRENQELRDELEQLRSGGHDYIETYSDVGDPSQNEFGPGARFDTGFHITKYSPTEEKIKLFTSLFSGRTDVYARRWVNAKTGRSGYSPVCRNFWKDKICRRKRGGSCFDCGYSDYEPLADAIIKQHLLLTAGEWDVVGLYPLLEDNTTWFLAVDFDGDNWQSESFAFRTIATRYGFATSIERSRSGIGAHVWFFFAQSISAKTARRMGSALLTIAMDEYPLFSFKSYDRFFPNQDTLSKGGFGNLIALPLQGFARNNGNSEFLDETSVPYEDQWEYLSSVRRIAPEDVDSFVLTFGEKETLGVLSPLADPETEPDSKPWDKQNEKNRLTPTDFPETLSIVKANMLHIEKKELSPRALNRLRRLAAFSNPEYYEKQRLRLYIASSLARVIDASEETAEYLSIPRGCEAQLIALLENTNVNFQIIDKTEEGTPVQVVFSGKLRPEQRPAFRALAAEPIGILSAATAFGKTVVAARLIAERHTSTLILVHTTQLLEQWREKLEEHLMFDEECVTPLETTETGRARKALKIGYLQGAKNRLTGRVDVAMASSLLDKEDQLKPGTHAQDYGFVIVDECHHAAAHTIETVMRHLHAKYACGLTATPQRKDGLQPLVFMHCGPVRYTVNEKAQNKKRGFVHQVIPCFTDLQLPDAFQDQPGITDVFTAIADNEERNAQIVDDVIAALDGGRTPLILTQTTRQAKVLTEALESHCSNVVLLTGGRKPAEKKATEQKLADSRDGERLALVATGKFVGEGFDFPRLDTLFIASPVSWKGLVQQYVGRLNRSYGEKQLLQIYDYIDIGIKKAESMYFNRLKHYKSQDYQILSGDESNLDGRCVFDGKEFWEPLFADISKARKEVVIASPRLYSSGVMHTIKLLSTHAAQQGKCIKVITSPISAYPSEKQSSIKELHQLLASLSDTTLVIDQNLQSSYVVIDRVKVWFGNVSPLGYTSAKQAIMRFVSREIAERLLSPESQ